MLFWIVSSLLAFSVQAKHLADPAIPTFSVAVQQSLATYAEFEVRARVLVDENENTRFLQVVMPAELMSATWGFSLKEKQINPDGSVLWMGANSSATCWDETLQQRCSLSFRNLTVTFQDVDVYLRATYSDPTELEKREEVARRFLAKPEGILLFPKEKHANP